MGRERSLAFRRTKKVMTCFYIALTHQNTYNFQLLLLNKICKSV